MLKQQAARVTEIRKYFTEDGVKEEVIYTDAFSANNLKLFFHSLPIYIGY